MSEPIITRFAPSPTGYLHIGGARTALFNYLFAKHHNGKFLLRIEDTDRQRSTQGAIDAILEGLNWLGLQADEDPTYQFSRKERHQEVVQQMLDKGTAYKCYASKEELEAMRETARAAGLPPVYNGLWRDRDEHEAPSGIQPVIRLKSEAEGETLIHDLVQGTVRFDNQSLDDLILLRSDGSPTYMLAVVVDDHDMGVTHVIRGDDHLNNAARQAQIYKAIGWDMPKQAHIPLIHGADGAKLSKRHGALGVEAYKDMGLLPDGLLNYLARLGWAHGDQEFFTKEELIEFFNIEKVSKGASRLDFDKLYSVNAQHMRALSPEALFTLWQEFAGQHGVKHEDILAHQDEILRALPSVTQKAKTFIELTDQLSFIFNQPPFTFEDKDQKHFSEENIGRLKRLKDKLEAVRGKGEMDAQQFEALIDEILLEDEIKLGKFGPSIRLALTSTTKAPSLGDIFTIFGAEEVIKRLERV